MRDRESGTPVAIVAVTAPALRHRMLRYSVAAALCTLASAKMDATLDFRKPDDVVDRRADMCLLAKQVAAGTLEVGDALEACACTCEWEGERMDVRWVRAGERWGRALAADNWVLMHYRQ